MRVVTWNMGYWQHRAVHDQAWRWLIGEMEPDVALLQECEPPQWVREDHEVIWDRAYPGGRQTWGTALVVRDRSMKPTCLTALDEWFANLPSELPSTGELAGIHRSNGWCATGVLGCPDGKSALVVSVHNPAYSIEKELLSGVDIEGIKLRPTPSLSWQMKLLEKAATQPEAR